MIPRIILDASVTLGWPLNENDGESRIKPVIDASDLVAPSLWRLEVTNAVLVKERRKILTPAQGASILLAIDRMPVQIVTELSVGTATLLAQLARTHQLSAYDAVYLDLAVALGLPLFTRDQNLMDAAKRIGVQLVSEKST